ncbi:hypothetical protein [Variovorax sp. CY25R-8]|uniref:hypothetical protein n=1 Tax=Variovorax sp. CY25R-8 TaxID=2855501 RepID=UPI0021BAE55C|nr:hypothetical protein [Variovorax sp. CY25R-8]MCT8176463.1 hypothetical protein [Variovorax sp. CY25R-8]
MKRRQAPRANLLLVGALTSALLLAACGGSNDSAPLIVGSAPPPAGSTDQPPADTGPVAQPYVTPPRLCEAGPGDQAEPGVNGHIPKSAMYDATANPDGFQGYWCGARKVAQNTLFGRGAFGDLQIKAKGSTRCAYASNRDGAAGGDAALTTGIIVFDMKTPTKMQVVPASGDTTVVGTAPSATVKATSTNKWGEETTAATPVNPNGKILRTPAAIEAYSGLELSGDLLVAGYKDNKMVDVYDVSDCLHPVPLNASYQSSGGHHDGWLSPDGKTWYGVPFGTTAKDGGTTLITGGTSPTDDNFANYTIDNKRVDLHITNLDDPKNPKLLLSWNRSQLPDEVKNNKNWRIMAATNIHDVSTNPDGTRLYLAVYGGGGQVAGNLPTPTTTFWRDQTCANGLLIMDSSDIVKRVADPKLKYVSFLSWCDQQPNPEFEQGGYARMTSTAATHATEWVRHVNGKEYIVSTDESYALTTSDTNGLPNQCKQQSFGRMIDISDEKHPKIVGTYEQDANKASVCPTLVAEGGNVPMVHYLNFDDRNHMRVAVYAAASGGIRFADWTDPTSPKEIGYYVARRNTPSKMDFTRPDPRYDAENCLYYTGWNQGGLVSLELTNPQYNPCMSRSANVSGKVATAQGDLTVALKAGRDSKGPSVSLSIEGLGNKVQLGAVTRLGSAIDADGAQVTATSNSVQIDADGSFDGQPAKFRLQVTDNGGNKGFFSLSCTEGCSFTTNGYLQSGGKLTVANLKS